MGHQEEKQALSVYHLRGQEMTQHIWLATLALNYSESESLGCDSSGDSKGLMALCSPTCQSSWARQLPSSESPTELYASTTPFCTFPSKCFAFSIAGSLLKYLFPPKKAILYLHEQHPKPLPFLCHCHHLPLLSTYYLYISLWLLNIFKNKFIF